MKILNETRLSIGHFGTASLISLILVAPFIFLELRYNTQTSLNLRHFPLPIFGILWFLGTVFIITIAPIVRKISAGNSLLAFSSTLLFRFVFLAFVAWMWGAIIIDQLPCFFGIPNCD